MRIFAAIRDALHSSTADDAEDEATQAVIRLIVWGRGPKPPYWRDAEVRRLLVSARLRNDGATIDQARHLCLSRFGSERTPSRSAIGRLWRRIQDQGLIAVATTSTTRGGGR